MQYTRFDDFTYDFTNGIKKELTSKEIRKLFFFLSRIVSCNIQLDTSSVNRNRTKNKYNK